jgi:RNA polymerase sigma-70 factor, ECF subfamily
VTGGRAAGSVEDVFREEHGRLLAALVRQFGDLDLAEEVAADAIEAALQRWPVDGVPGKPAAWLLTTARRRAIDVLRRNRSYATRLALLQVEAERSAPAAVEPGEDVPDERLRLFFTCCHPALPLDAQIALTLRCLAGLDTPEVARAFLLPTATAAQRIVRAKRKIRDARIPFRVPEAGELPARLPGVLRVLYLIFTEGYAASTGDALVRGELVAEAIRLARILHRLLPAEREVAGLLALLLLVDARRAARTGPAGELVLLAEQDRSRWDADRIAEGRALLEAALPGGSPGPYALQAAIAAVHDEAVDAARTDWPQVVALYDVLTDVAPSPVVALNRAVAVAMRDGPAAGLELLDALAADERLRGYHLLPAARADLLRRLGRAAEAAVAYEEALALVGNAAERAYLARRLKEVGARPPVVE